MVSAGIVVTVGLLGAIFGALLVCLDLLPELKKLRDDNARLRERWRHCFRHHQRHLNRKGDAA